MRRCPGLHCPGCGDHGGGELAALVVVLVIVGAVLHAIWHTIVEAAEIAALVLVSAVSLAAIGGAVYAAMRIRARVLGARARRTVPAPSRVIRLGEPPIVIDSTTGQAIEAPKPRPASWPLPGDWAEIRARIGRDG